MAAINTNLMGKSMKRVLTAVLLGFWVVVPASTASADAVPTRLAGWVEAYESFNLEQFLGFYAADVRFTDPTARIDFKSRQELKAAYTNIMQGRWGGNYRFKINSVVNQDDLIVFEGLFSLTFNGKKGEIAFTTWLEFEDGKIKRQLDMFDYGALRQQLPEFGQSLPSEYTGPRD